MQIEWKEVQPKDEGMCFSMMPPNAHVLWLIRPDCDAFSVSIFVNSDDPMPMKEATWPREAIAKMRRLLDEIEQELNG